MTKDTFMGRSIYPTHHKKEVPLGARVYPVRPGKARLSEPAYHDFLGELKSLVEQTGDVFSSCYEALLINLADFVQRLPEDSAMPTRGMLGVAMKRGFLVTKEFIEHMQAKHGKHFYRQDRGARLTYAVFSASLLFRVAKVVADKQVFLCDKNGKVISRWMYFDHAMTSRAKYFKMRMVPVMPDATLRHMTTVLAKQLMPSLGFAWLSEDLSLLGLWFSALNILDEIFSVYQIGLDVEELMRQSAIDFSEDEVFEIAHDVLLGEAFWEWLSDQVLAHDQGVTLERDGIGLIDGALFFDVDRWTERFAKERQCQQRAVVRQLKDLGLLQMRDGELLKTHLRVQSQGSTVASTGLYGGQASRTDAMDAKRFVGVDTVIAAACFRGYNGLQMAGDLSSDAEETSIFTRLVSTFLGDLASGANILQKGGGL